MPAEPLYPLSFDPIIKCLLWGGRRLGTVLHKPIGAEGRCAESWEVADHRDDVSRVGTGPLAGAGLRDLIRTRGDELLGRGRSRRRPEQFPLLVKFLDARDVLSVQVHPDDEKGRRAVFGESDRHQADPHFRDYLLFFEYFHGDTGLGLGASHQTGWTGLVAKLLQPRRTEVAECRAGAVAAP